MIIIPANITKLIFVVKAKRKFAAVNKKPLVNEGFLSN